LVQMQHLSFNCRQIFKHTYKYMLLFSCAFISSLPASFSQSTYYYKSSQTLKHEKEKAISEGNQTRSNEIAKEIDLRNADQHQMEALNAELNKKIEAEEYLEAETIKGKLNDIKSRQTKAEEIRTKLEASIASEDYETAEKYKTELMQISPPAQTPSTSVQKTETDDGTAEKIKKEQEERERTEAERIRQEEDKIFNSKQSETAKQEAERLTQEAEKVKQETERLKQESEKVKREMERLKQEELARAEAEKLNAKKAAEEKAEAQRLALQKAAQEKLEAERLATQQAQEEKRKIEEQKALEFSLYGFTVTDDFSDNRNNWNEESFYDRRAQISGGKMVLETSNEHSSYRTDHGFPLNLDKDFTMETTTRWVRGEDKNGYGIDYASDYEGNRYYSFQVAAIGYYSILYYENNQWGEIIPWKSSSAVNRGTEPNRLKIKKEGNELFFYANDVLLTIIPWKSAYGKDFGFRILDKQLVEFDDFVIKGIKAE
jgi:hypothetical protein